MHAQAAAPLRRALTAFTQTALLGDCVVARPALPERRHHPAETRQPPPGRTGGPSADRSGKTPAPPPPPSAAASSLGPAAAAAAAACARASAVAAAGSARRRCRTSSSARAPARRGAEVLQTRAEVLQTRAKSAAGSGQPMACTGAVCVLAQAQAQEHPRTPWQRVARRRRTTWQAHPAACVRGLSAGVCHRPRADARLSGYHNRAGWEPGPARALALERLAPAQALEQQGTG